MRLNKLLVIIVFLGVGCDSTQSTTELKSPPNIQSGIVVPSVGTAPQKNSDTFTVVMLGDSLTSGFGLPPNDALPEQIEKILVEVDASVHVVNAGVSGDTSAGGLARYDWSVASALPDLLIISLGANDYLNGIDPQRTKANVGAIIERAQADGIDILLVSVSVRSNAIDDPRAQQFASIYPSLAETFGVKHYGGLLSDIQHRPELLLPDGLHPTAEGVRIIAAPLVNEIMPYVSAEEVRP